MRITRIGIGIAAVLLLSTSILAQARKPMPRGEMDKYVISAKAGVVNLVEGDAQVFRAQPFAVPDTLISGDELQNGDTVRTGTTGRAEILLNPGCYLRLGAESAFVFLFDSATNDRLKLIQGSAVLEASAVDGPITIDTPKGHFEIARDGIYRFNISPDGKAEVAVRKGRAVVGAITIKDGKVAVVDGATAAIAKLNKQDIDALDDWSKERSKALIAANSRLSNVGIGRTMSMAFMRNAWIYDPFCRCRTFLPFVSGFSSPYGWEYSVCNPYGYYYSRPRYNNGGGTGGGGTQSGGGGSYGGGSGSGGGSGGGRGGGTVISPPPSREPRPDPPGRGASPGERGGGTGPGPRRP